MTRSDPTTLCLDDVRRAQAALAAHLTPSPLVAVDGVRTAGGAPVLLKAECLLPTGSFKIRGALAMLAGLAEGERQRGVIAYSTGNHAQAVAMAARMAGMSATIVMSPDAPAIKVAATERLGAAVVMAEPTSQARKALAERIAAEKGALLVPPYDHAGVMAGQGTIGLEIAAGPENRITLPSAVYVPVGGGGLLAGIAVAIKALAPAVRVIGVEPDLEDDTTRSFRAGERIALPGPSASIAEAIKVQTPGEHTFPLIRRFVDDMVTVSEAETVAALRLAQTGARLVLEPAGAVALAAALKDRAATEGPVIAVASGGNVEPGRYARLLTGEVI